MVEYYLWLLLLLTPHCNVALNCKLNVQTGTFGDISILMNLMAWMESIFTIVVRCSGVTACVQLITPISQWLRQACHPWVPG